MTLNKWNILNFKFINRSDHLKHRKEIKNFEKPQYIGNDLFEKNEIIETTRQTIGMNYKINDD